MKKRLLFLIVFMLVIAGCSKKGDSVLEPSASGTEMDKQTGTIDSEVASFSSEEESTWEEENETEADKVSSAKTESAGSTIPGSWTLPEGWIIAEKYSGEEQVFLVKEGQEDEQQPDNISLYVGSNQYTKEKHMDFRDAITRQLTLQISGIKAELNGTGTYTAQDYILYIFTIKEEETNIVTKQYYIVDDYRYCLIHVTNFTGDESVDETAQAIADSFVWKE